MKSKYERQLSIIAMKKYRENVPIDCTNFSLTFSISSLRELCWLSMKLQRRTMTNYQLQGRWQAQYKMMKRFIRQSSIILFSTVVEWCILLWIRSANVWLLPKIILRNSLRWSKVIIKSIQKVITVFSNLATSSLN